MMAYDPLRGVDGGFTHHSIHTRLPKILDETLRCNESLSEDIVNRLLKLRTEIVEDACLPKLSTKAAWDAFVIGGQRWLESPWWLVENYFYRRILDEIGYFEGTYGDPFESQKADALAHAKDAFISTVIPLLVDEDLTAVLLRSLWGNVADLSLSAGKISAIDARTDLTEHILVNASADVIAHIKSSPSTAGSKRTIVIVLDNCGLELLSDLALTHALLQSGHVDAVHLHCKVDPVFVSDAMLKDVHNHITYLASLPNEACKALSRKLESYLGDGRLVLKAFAFYNSPLHGNQMPSDVSEALRGAVLAIVKGDANYRRLLGDLHWPHDTPFDSIVDYYPCPVVALRTCKAGVICGIPKEVEAAVCHEEDWMYSGKYGIIQFAPGHHR